MSTRHFLTLIFLGLGNIIGALVAHSHTDRLNDLQARIERLEAR